MPRYPRDAGNKTLMTPMKKKLCVPLFAMFALSTVHAAEGDVITVTPHKKGKTTITVSTKKSTATFAVTVK